MLYILLLTVAALCLTGVVMVLWAFRYAAEGQEDERGFRRVPSSFPPPASRRPSGEEPTPVDAGVPVGRATANGHV